MSLCGSRYHLLVWSNIMCLCLSGSRRNAMKDDDRADLLWRPENVINSSGHEGKLMLYNHLTFYAFHIFL